ncbi:uncharacterized protein J7T54_004654 [Emericellopsis cladophorae]|uniref:Uncharacterized protein n=1 Tax=Emericellopsis cladophorae TaxID=2686198 RepID=A0A9P9Y5T3_9HYPO|nr:uncharacterized protein J7T54_004654 [Emericellopsis cladophorae]KAI6784108.1 hypothetical protein J7T54_004654 [Emericellopsis cladophorae]
MHMQHQDLKRTTKAASTRYHRGLLGRSHEESEHDHDRKSIRLHIGDKSLRWSRKGNTVRSVDSQQDGLCSVREDDLEPRHSSPLSEVALNSLGTLAPTDSTSRSQARNSTPTQYFSRDLEAGDGGTFHYNITSVPKLVHPQPRKEKTRLIQPCSSEAGTDVASSIIADAGASRAGGFGSSNEDQHWGSSLGLFDKDKREPQNSTCIRDDRRGPTSPGMRQAEQASPSVSRLTKEFQDKSVNSPLAPRAEALLGSKGFKSEPEKSAGGMPMADPLGTTPPRNMPLPCVEAPVSADEEERIWQNYLLDDVDMFRVKHQAQEEALACTGRGLMRSPTGQDPHHLALPALTTTTGSTTASQTASIASACPTDAATSASVELEPPPPPPRANQSTTRQPVFFKKQERPRLPKAPARCVGRLSSMEGPSHIISQPFGRPVKRGRGKALDGWADTERQNDSGTASRRR